jgi:hypothetical protein
MTLFINNFGQILRIHIKILPPSGVVIVVDSLHVSQDNLFEVNILCLNFYSDVCLLRTLGA